MYQSIIKFSTNLPDFSVFSDKITAWRDTNLHFRPAAVSIVDYNSLLMRGNFRTDSFKTHLTEVKMPSILSCLTEIIQPTFSIFLIDQFW